MMLDAAVVAEVERLLAEGQLSQRQIAAVAGVSRGTVGAIATGRRPDYSLRPKPKLRPLPSIFVGPAVRCPTCGAMVRLPIGSKRCLACVIRYGPDERPPLAPPERELD